MSSFRICTAKAPVNIAVIKYWGKRDEDLILPINDSISVTLSKKQMCATTTVACSKTFESDKIWLNGKQEDLTIRLKNCIKEIKNRAKLKGNADILEWPLHIASENNFPTAAGLASSAAGFACLVKALSALYDLDDELSIIARQGSGSACRSIYGGFVQWLAGKETNGRDSYAKQIATKIHWPQLKVLVLVVNAEKKPISSTIGMKLSVQTSALINYRASVVVPSRIEKMIEAIMKRDFSSFADLTMKDSNQFHAICHDTYPPIHYINSISYKIIDLVHAYNKYYNENKVAYTFDAGPNACLFLLEDNVPEIFQLICKIFPPLNKVEFIKGEEIATCSLSQKLIEQLNVAPHPGGIHYVINTQVGEGPIIVENAEHLLNHSGLPY